MFEDGADPDEFTLRFSGSMIGHGWLTLVSEKARQIHARGFETVLPSEQLILLDFQSSELVQDWANRSLRHLYDLWDGADRDPGRWALDHLAIGFMYSGPAINKRSPTLAAERRVQYALAKWASGSRKYNEAWFRARDPEAIISKMEAEDGKTILGIIIIVALTAPVWVFPFYVVP